MFAEVMSYEYFLFWYSFIIAWFFVAAFAIYFVVIKDGIAAVWGKSKHKNQELETVILAKS
ncbi:MULTISPECIES: hypothetical protein [Bacillaceae]|uniref:hypothetical protein n=1 Tax=Bacillaceae TaxID=186817 RepID=UPI00099E0C96|nr:hypothetical protein [Priestia flexa]AQX56613.1 hypothetical protein BC359_20600 [Priestia flexa]